MVSPAEAVLQWMPPARPRQQSPLFGTDWQEPKGLAEWKQLKPPAKQLVDPSIALAAAASFKDKAAEIDSLFAQLREYQRQARQLAAPTVEFDDHIRRTLERLTTLQMEEAQRIRREFEASLSAPIGAGLALLKRVKDQLASHKDPSG